LFENGFGGLLCDDMGLGKTHQVMALMTAFGLRSEKSGPCLVVCPTTVISHWQKNTHRKYGYRTQSLSASMKRTTAAYMSAA
jgi:SNF2 family DNA or RNA helicase